MCIRDRCVTTMTKELMGVVSRYDLMDFPFMVADVYKRQAMQ